jgi:hypothetical protein
MRPIQASLAASKAELLYGRRVTMENKLTFDSKLPHLGSFRFFLTVICEELVEYHVWPVCPSEIRADNGTMVRLTICWIGELLVSLLNTSRALGGRE